MLTTTIENGCYRIEITTADDGHTTVATLCPGFRIGRTTVPGHYVSLSPEQAIAIVRHLCERMPEVADTIALELSAS